MGKLIAVILLIGIGVDISFVAMSKIEERVNAIAQRMAEEKKAAQAAAMQRAKELEIAKAKESEIARIAAEKEAERIRKQKMPEEEERKRTHPEHLAAAELGVKNATIKYNELTEKVKDLRRRTVIAQARLKEAEEKAKAWERIENTARRTQDRLEGQYQGSIFDSGARQRASWQEREAASRSTRGITVTTAEAKAAAEKAEIIVQLLEQELIEAEIQLQKAQSILNSQIELLERIKSEAVN